MQVALCVSWLSEHEDVIPSDMSTAACQCTTVETLRCSRVPEYVNLPLLADNSDYVRDKHISSIALF